MIQEEIHIDPQLLNLISSDQAWLYHVLPVVKKSETTYTFLVAEDYATEQTYSFVEFLTGASIHWVIYPLDEVTIFLHQYYPKQGRFQNIQSLSYNPASDEFLEMLLLEAKQVGSSDIHIEIYETEARVRFRIDGHLIVRFAIDLSHYPALINRIKIMSYMDISEKRLPQDGRIDFDMKGEKFDLRVSVLPTLFGEKVVLRILSQDATAIDISLLGFDSSDLENYLEGVKRKQGLVLISGPTGSGKTTTLYATLKLLNDTTRNIVTIEDPIEYTLKGINQVQLKENIGLDFTKALRTFLRQDPNIIMLGEIRDAETAAMAIRASLTGHLVLSTIHTNSAWGTVSRLIDMNVPPFLLANTLSTSVAQRLIRLLCPVCKQKVPFTKEMFPKAFKYTSTISFHYIPKGCSSCYDTGYKGRKAVYEVIPIDQELAECIRNRKYDIESELKERSILSLTQNALRLLESGETSLEEIYPLLLNH